MGGRSRRHSPEVIGDAREGRSRRHSPEVIGEAGGGRSRRHSPEVIGYEGRGRSRRHSPEVIGHEGRRHSLTRRRSPEVTMKQIADAGRGRSPRASPEVIGDVDGGRSRRHSPEVTTTPRRHQRHREEHRPTFEEVQSQIRDLVLKDRDQQVMRDAQLSDANDSSRDSVLEMLKAITNDEISSHGVEASMDHGQSIGSEMLVLMPPRGGSRATPKGGRVGLVVPRPKPSFHRWCKPKDARLKTKEKKAKNIDMIPLGGLFDKRAAIREELSHTSQDLSSKLVVKPTNKEIDKKVDPVTKAEGTVKEDARTEILEMLKKVHIKAEKLGRIRKLMEVMEEHGEIGEAPKRDILVDMLLAVNVEGKDECETVEQVEKAVERKDDVVENVKPEKHKRTSSRPTDVYVQQPVEEPEAANQKRKSDKKSKRLSKQHAVSHGRPESGKPPSLDRVKTNDEEREPRREEKSFVGPTKEPDVKAAHAAHTHRHGSLREDAAQMTRKKKPHGGHRGKRTAHAIVREQRDHDASEGGDAGWSVTPNRAEHGDVGTREDTDADERPGKSEAKQGDHGLAWQASSTVTDWNDPSKTRQEDTSVVSPRGLTTSCFSNVRSKQMEEHMAKVLAEYLAKKQQFQKFIEQEELSRQQEMMKYEEGRDNDECTGRLDRFGVVGSGIHANVDGGGQPRDVIRISKEVDIVRNVTTCCCAHSVCSKHVQGVVGGLEGSHHPDDSKCRRGVEDVKLGAQPTSDPRCEERERFLQRNSLTSRSETECRVLPPMLAKRENIMSLSHEYVKPLEFESNKLNICCSTKGDYVNPETFSKQDTYREDYVINKGDMSKQVWSPPRGNHAQDDPRVISLMSPRSHFQVSTNAIDENPEKPKGDVFNDPYKSENSPIVRQLSAETPQRTSAPNEEGRVQPQRFAGGCAGDNNGATVEPAKPPEPISRQQIGVDVNPTSGSRMGPPLDNAMPTSPEREPSQHESGSSVPYNVQEGISRDSARVVEINSADIIQCRRDMSSTHGDSTNIVSCIDTPDKAMEEIFKKMDDVIINRFLTLASINGITIVVTPRLVVNENAQGGSEELKEGNTKGKLSEITKEESECGNVGEKVKEISREEISNAVVGSGSSKEVVYKIVSVDDKSEIFPAEMFKNEPVITVRHKSECPLPGEGGAAGGESDKTLLDRIDTVIGNQERMQPLAVRNSRQLESSSCHFKRSDVYYISHVLCKSTGAIRRERKAQTRLRRSKTTRTRSKPWRTGRGTDEARHGEPAADRQVAAKASADLRMLEEIALINVPDTSGVAAPKVSQGNFDRCYEQVLRCVPAGMEKGIKYAADKGPAKLSFGNVSSGEKTRKEANRVLSKLSPGEKGTKAAKKGSCNVSPREKGRRRVDKGSCNVCAREKGRKRADKVSSQVSPGEKARKGEEKVSSKVSFCENPRAATPVDRFLENVRNNLDEDELQMLARVSSNSLPNSKDVDVIYRSRTYEGSNSTSTVALANMKTIEEIIAEADTGDDNLLSICECFGVATIDDLMGRLTSSDDVVAVKTSPSRDVRRERRHGAGQHLKAQKTHHRRVRREVRREEMKVRHSASGSNSDGTSVRHRGTTTTTTTTTSTENSIPSAGGNSESKEVWRHHRLSKVIDIDEWIRDGAVATRDFPRQENNVVARRKTKRRRKRRRAMVDDEEDPVDDDCTRLSKFVLNYAMKSGIILGGGGRKENNNNNNNNNNKDGDCVNVKIELGDKTDTLIVIEVPDDDRKTSSKMAVATSSRPACGVTTPLRSGAQIVHVDSEEIVLDTSEDEATTPLTWTRVEQEAFRTALKRHPPTPRVWDRIARSVGRSKRECVLHFMRIWRRLEGRAQQ